MSHSRTNRPRRIVPPEQRDEYVTRVRDLNAQGWSDRRVAAELDLSPDTIRMLRLSAGVPPANTAPFRPEQPTLHVEQQDPECPVCDQPVAVVRRFGVTYFDAHQRLGRRRPDGVALSEPCRGGGARVPEPVSA
jgi:hypothetical protein